MVGSVMSTTHSASSATSLACRICHTGTSRERLISPCHCKGSLAYVHLSCLERWLNQAGRSDCELCMYKYEAIQTMRYNCLESLRIWATSPTIRTHIQADCLICGLLTIVTGGLLAVCLFGMRYFLIEGSKLGVSDTWTRGSVGVFLAIVVAGYVVTIYLLVRDQIVPWFRWWRSMVNVRLIISPREPVERLHETIV